MQSPFMFFAGILASTTLALASVGANATDMFNQDDVSYIVSYSTPDGTKTVDLGPQGDLINLCEGCQVSLDDGQMIEAEPQDVVAIVEGKLSITELTQ